MTLLRSATKRVLVQQISPGERIDPQYAALIEPVNGQVEFRPVREIKFWAQQKSVFLPCEGLFAQTADWLLQTAGR
jgi:hypothetical protein